MIYEHKVFLKSFYATYSVGLFTIFLISSMFIYTPIVLELLQISKQQFSYAPTFFGVFVILSNLLASRFLIPKIGTTNCLIISRLIISFIPLSIFYIENYYFLLLSFSFLGIGMGIQAPCALTQVTIIEKKTDRILMPIFKTSWAIGAMLAAIFSSISLWLDIDPSLHFLIFGVIAILGIIFIFIYGLKKEYDSINDSPSLSLPTLNTFLFGSINMVQMAIMGIITLWSSVWLLEDLNSSLFLAGSIVFFFNLGSILSNFIAPRLIKLTNELIVGPYFSILGSIVLFFCTLTMNVYIICIGITVFGFLTSNIMPIIFRQSVKMSSKPIPTTISHITSLGQSGFVFGPALVGYSAEVNGLTFNVYAFCILFLLISILMAVLIKQKEW